jgi:hypothetical protein
MYVYSAYGLRIVSALPLPELVANEAPLDLGNNGADVTIHFGPVASLPLTADGTTKHVHATAKGVYLSWPEVGTFLVHDGREIVIDSTAAAEEHLRRLFILGPALAIVLQQRGQVAILHASVVAISGGAAAFVGVKGIGKSSLAAILHARGHNLVADDILAIDTNCNPPMALPGFPHLRLWPDAIASLGHAPEALPRLRPELEKRSYPITDGFSSTPVPLQCLYVLGYSSELQIEPLQPQEALKELMAHWYGARFGIELLRAIGYSSFFRQCADLTARLSVYRLNRPASLHALPDVARRVEEHLAHDMQRARG